MSRNTCEAKPRRLEPTSVKVLWVTPGVVLTRIRAVDGIWDVSFNRLQGWSCTCRMLGCAHVAAVQQLTSKRGHNAR